MLIELKMLELVNMLKYLQYVQDKIYNYWIVKNTKNKIRVSIYTLSDLGVLSNLIGLLSLANEHYSPPTE